MTFNATKIVQDNYYKNQEKRIFLLRSIKVNVYWLWGNGIIIIFLNTDNLVTLKEEVLTIHMKFH